MSEQNVTPEDDEFDQAFAEFSGETTDTENYLQQELPDDDQVENQVETGDDVDLEQESSEDDTDFESTEDEQEDPYAHLDDDVRAEIERIRGEASDWRHRYQSDAGRVSALQRKINELENKLSTPAPTVADIEQMVEGGDEDEMNEFKEDYPDIAKAVDRMVAAKLKQERNQNQQALQQMDNRYQQVLQPIREQEHERSVREQESSLENLHPDWRDIATSASFGDWVSRQPEAVRAMVSSDYADDASYVLDSYKAMSGNHRAPSTPNPGVENVVNKRQQVLNNASAPRTRRSAPKTGVPENFEDAFAYYASKP